MYTAEDIKEYSIELLNLDLLPLHAAEDTQRDARRSGKPKGLGYTLQI